MSKQMEIFLILKHINSLFLYMIDYNLKMKNSQNSFYMNFKIHKYKMDILVY